MIKLSILTPVWNQEELVLKGLDSIPRRDDIEVLVRDDGSDDNTLANLKKYKAEHPELNMKVFSNGENLGVAATANRLIDSATGEWFHFLMSDDYLFTNEYAKMIDYIYQTKSDIVCLDLVDNNGFRYKLSDEMDDYYCAQACRFIKREFVKGIRYPERCKCGEDYWYHIEMMERKPSVEYTHILAYHYNFPRVGSLVNLRSRGLIPEEDCKP